MSRSSRRRGLAPPALLMALGIGIFFALPAQAAGSWSSPVQLPAGCASSVATGSVAVNAAGAEVAAANVNGISAVSVCTSSDGQTWSAPITVGQGVSPAVALAPDGRVVVAWEGGTFAATDIEASVRAPGGAWSAPVVVSTVGSPGAPLIGIDGSGDAVIGYVQGATGTIATASLRAGGSWTPVQTLTTRYGSGLDLAVNSTGAVILTWAAKGTSVGVYAASGTVLGGLAAPVKVGLPLYPGGRTSVAVNNAGQAAMVWAMGSGAANVAATRTAAGTWSVPVQLSANEAGPLDVAIDGAGNAIAVFEQFVLSGGSYITPLFASKLPAGGSWGTPTQLSAPGDSVTNAGGGGRVVADPAGTVVVAWADATTRTLTALTSPPGGGFGPAFSVPNVGQIGRLVIAPGHAALTFNSVITSEAVS